MVTVINPLELFMAQYMPDVFTTDIAPVHRQMSSLFSNDNETRLAIDAFRGSAKSTYLSRGKLLHCVAESKYKKIYLIARTSGTKGLSTQWMRLLQKDIEENQLLQFDYNLRRGAKWNEDYCQIIRADGSMVEVYAQGKGSSIRGARDLSAIMLFDDLQDVADQQSEAVLYTDELWFVQDVLPIPLPGQRMIMIGQNLSPVSLMARIEVMPSWRYIRFPLEEPVGSGYSVWPSMWSDEWIEGQKKDMGIDAFNAEYNCIPRVSGNPLYRREWFRFYKPDSDFYQEDLRRGFYIVTFIDGAESKRDASHYTAIVTLGAVLDNALKVYVLDVKRAHWTVKEGAAQVLITYNDFKQNKTIAESRVKDGDALTEEIKSQERMHGSYCNLFCTKPVQDKVTRSCYVQSLVQQGLIYFIEDDPMQQQLMSELVMFTGDQRWHDDMHDSFVGALTELKDWHGKRRVTVGVKRVLPHGARANEITGVVR